MGKKSKKSKKDKHDKRASKLARERGDGDEDSSAVPYDAVTAQMIRIGNADRTHEMDENDYHKLDDKIDDKEKMRLKRAAARRKADSEAEDYDEKKEKRNR